MRMSYEGGLFGLLTLIVVGPLYAASDVVAKIGLSGNYSYVFSDLSSGPVKT